MSISSGTIIRSLVLLLALANQILVTVGKSPLPITDEQIEQLVSLLFTVIASLWAYWKNNSLTRNAKAADVYLAKLRNRG